MILAAVASLASGVIGAMGTIAAGKAQAAAYEHEAKQYDIKAAWERAVAEREADEKRLEADYAASRARAVASTYRGSVDSGDVKLISEIQGRGNYLSGLASAQGEQAAFSNINAGNVSRFWQSVTPKLAGISAAGQFIGGAGAAASSISGMFGKYGGGGYKSASIQPSLIYG